MGIWTDARSNIYVADYDARAVKRIAPDGRVGVVARSTAPWAPTGGLFAPDGALWLLEATITNAVRVRCLRPGGRAIIY
jgi:sugar lactone lactonase YvrE